MKCRRIRGRLNAYVDRELDSSQMKAVAKHLRQCPECRSEVQALSQLDMKMRQLVSPEPSLGFNEKVMKEILSLQPKRSHPFQRWVPALTYSLLFFAVLYMGILWNQPLDERKATIAESPSWSEPFEESGNMRLSQLQDNSMESMWRQANETR